MAAGIRDLYHGSGSVKSIQRLEFSKNCSFQYYFTKPLRTGLYFLTLKKLKTTKIGTPRQCLGAFLTYLEPLKKHNSPKFVTFTTRAWLNLASLCVCPASSAFSMQCQKENKTQSHQNLILARIIRCCRIKNIQTFRFLIIRWRWRRRRRHRENCVAMAC